ncbi:MAG: bifunctional demethylmenaquinone methyltransferase/2-methoxy-6-polyprenyl-1,4-benzoquinol methylase UbiE [Leptolyngbyaceae cyanobacterium bins.302]|nr:bifunctional demethylmenaquinone methyltransferase/2-methoxy-6-polyprenyl-1,4-benzoquinol methylase UbiE [Leptolyngbyaceae cyanobacterium bins.302]
MDLDSRTPDSVRELFDRIAPVYDQLNQWLSLGQHRIWKKMAIKWSGAKPGDVCLDVCCGSGDLALGLAEQVGKSGQVIGVDFSQEQLAIAQQRTRAHQPITWQAGDALNLPFADNFFDAATMGYGLRNVMDIPKCLRELYRVLKPGANAAILDLNHPTNPLVQNFQQWYLDTIVVPIATRYGFSQEYAYLAPSLDRFPTGTEQVNLAHQVGFSAVTHYPIAGGTMGVLVVRKN